MTIPQRALAIATLVLAAAVAAPAQAQPPDEVDQTLLVPTTLDSSFAPFICKAKRTGPVCTGERHLVADWAPADWPCGPPVYGASREDRWTTRYYNTDYLNYDRLFRTHNVDYLSTSATGPATAIIRTNARFREPFEVPGDDSTITVITTGTIWDVRSVARRPDLPRGRNSRGAPECWPYVHRPRDCGRCHDLVQRRTARCVLHR